jgi:N-acetylneuraminic acid mutarotase
MFVLRKKSWVQLESLLIPRCGHASINVNRKILLFGGYVSGSWSASVHSLELDGGEWITEPDLPDPVAGPAAAQINDNTFLMEMYDNELFQQDEDSKVWSRKAECPGSRCIGARMTAACGQLLVAGGNSENMFRCYTPETNTWTTGKAPSLRHAWGALLFLDDKLILFGGKDEDRAEEYDFISQSWSLCAFKVPKKLMNLHAVALDM